MSVEFKLPELGENVEKGDVVRVLVAAGDVIKVDQPVVELETDKATIEVPSSVAGTVTAVRVKPGDKVKVGQVVLTLDEAAPADKAPAAAPAAAPTKTEASPAPAKAEAAAQAAPAKAEDTGKKDPGKTEGEVTKAQDSDAASAKGEARGDVVDISSGRPAAARTAEARPAAAPARQDGPTSSREAASSAPAAPSVRRFARELGVEIGDVTGSGPGGRIGPDDVKEHVKAALASGGGRVRQPALPDFSKWGDIDVKPMTNIRRKTAEHLSVAWQAPHVTQHDRADITVLEEFRHTYGPRVEKAGGKLTVTAMLIKVVAAAIGRYPQFASSVDLASESIVFKKYCHIGVAVDTPNGLLVPVIRNADRKTVTEIAVELASLSQKARDKKLSLDEMSGGVFSITNLGGIGGTSFTPIINQPEVAILGVSRTSTEPVWRENQFQPRAILPLSLSYDHRAIDGAEAARFLRFLAEGLEQPMSVFL